MTLEERINEEWKTALKQSDQLTKGCLGLVRSELKNESIKLRETLTDDQVQAVVRRMIKQHRETLELIAGKGASDNEAKINGEIAVLEQYLPQQLDEAAVAAVVSKQLDGKGFGPSDFGPAMRMVMTELKGKAEGKLVQQAVKAYLQG